MILLTRAEAEGVLGPSPTTPHSALEPAPLKDGNYVLPEDVLADPANADVAAFLTSKLVPGEPTPEQSWDFGPPDDPDQAEIDAYNAARLVWSEGGEQRLAAAGMNARSIRNYLGAYARKTA